MLRFFILGVLGFLTVVTVLAAAVGGWAWWVAAAIVVALLVLGVWDVTQKKHSILRNFPVLGHVRYLMEGIRPELQQYFIERNYDGRPFDRDTRAAIYQRAKGLKEEAPFGTERDVNAIGYEYLVHSAVPRPVADDVPRVRIGGSRCTQPYDMALMNVSSMSFGALSGAAIEALNRGAALGGFAHETGEGGLSRYHRNGGDLVWEIGSGYFGCRTSDGHFDPDAFARTAALDQVKMISIKLSQGAKPGIGGVLPGAKVTKEIAEARGVPVGEKCVSPAFHTVFSTPRELVRFVDHLRELSGGKPVGFKLCVGSRTEFLAICKAMIDEDLAPDFIVVDGAEGGTGAAPQEYEDHVGMSLTEGLATVHQALVGAGLRSAVTIGASGKVTDGVDIVKRIIQGADYTNSARAMMMAVGCIQAQLCHTNTCPVGVATQDPRRARALDVPDKSQRVHRYQGAVVAQAQQVLASMGLDDFAALSPRQLRRRVSEESVVGYDQLVTTIAPGALVDVTQDRHDTVPDDWSADWRAADPDRFTP